MKCDVYKKATSILYALLIYFILFIGIVFNTNAQSCSSTTFTKYYEYNWRGQGGFFEKTNTGGYLFGLMKDERKKVITKVDVNANIIWSNAYDYIGSINLLNTFQYSNGVEDNDGNYFVDIQGDAFALLDPQGNIIQVKQLKGPNSNVQHETPIHSLLVLPNNKKLVFIQDYSGLGYFSYAVVCLSPDLSTILWTKYFKQNELYGHKLFYFEDKLFLLASTDSNPSSRGGDIITLDANTGSLINQTKFISNEVVGSIAFRNIYRYNNGFIVTGDNRTSGFGKYFILRLDDGFNIIQSYTYAEYFYNGNDPNTYDTPLIVEPSGDFYGAMTAGFGHFRFHISASDSIIWNKFSSVSGFGSLYNFYKTDNGLVLFCRSELPDVSNGVMNHSASISKSTYNGLFPSCTASTGNLEKLPLPLTKTISDIQVKDTILFTLRNLTGVVESNNFPSHNSCNGLSTCSSVVVQGPVSVCSSAPITFKALKNQQCFTSISWELIGGNTNMTVVNDSTVSIMFLQQGNYKVIAKLKVDCSIIADTLDVNVLAILPPLNIGPSDSALCSNSTIHLDANNGFISYLWQDGSIGQTYDVMQPGLYHVTVKDQCNQIFNDSIRIYPVTTPSFNIGNDKDVCVNDTIYINAPTGFQTYLWQPLNQVHGQGQNIYVIPKNNINISVIAKTVEGCIAKDTINLTALYPGSLNLGNDFNLCKGDTSIILASPGFINYEWNTGSHDQNIYAFSKGLYWLKALNMNGCYSRDTIEIKNVFLPIVPDLGSCVKLCELESKVIDAGEYSSYLWNDNSRARYLSINNAGKYWVSVVDKNNCKCSDTIYVIKKDCTESIYLPSSFTPNNDFKNDLFRAITFTNIPKYFELSVYNRYGEIVFYSTDITKGWDGRYKAEAQPQSMYVWRCMYKFDGKTLNSATGTVFLIR
jgi:gliding motility-associated-like protein